MATTDQLSATTTSIQRYAFAVITASAITQLIIAATGHEIGLLAAALTAAIAVGYTAFLIGTRGALGKIRFGQLATHIVTYAAVVSGYLLHFFILAVSGNPAVDPADGYAMEAGWFGVVIGMPTFWTLGLLMHTVGAILGRGYEAPR